MWLFFCKITISILDEQEKEYAKVHKKENIQLTVNN